MHHMLHAHLSAHFMYFSSYAHLCTNFLEMPRDYSVIFVAGCAMYSKIAEGISLRVAKQMSCKFTDVNSQAELLHVRHENRHVICLNTSECDKLHCGLSLQVN